ncbi:MAG: tetratricopeptide repeat protein [Planctomycetota bacterium]
MNRPLACLATIRPTVPLQLAVLSAVSTVLIGGGCATRSGGGLSAITLAPIMEKPDLPPPTLRIEPNDAEESQLAEARTAAQSDDYDTALRIFRDLLQENPTLADAYTGMAGVLEEQGDLRQAEPAYARAAALKPEDFEANAGHGRVLEALGRVKEAIRAVQRALAIRPRDADSNTAMSRLLLEVGQLDGAIAFAERAVEVNPQDGRAHLALGRAYMKAGRGPDAIREYETATELIEPPEDVILTLINAYAAEKRYREAANAAEALTRTTPSAAAYERLGWALFRLNEFDASAAAYRKSIEADPQYWPALNGVGVNALNGWIRGGRQDDDPLRFEARSMLQRSLKANPDQPKVVALLQKYML